MIKKKHLLAMVVLTCLSISVIAQSIDVASVGKFISDETAHHWTNNFKAKFPNATASHVVDKTLLTILLSSNDAQGIYFYNALNADGTTAVIPVACDETQTITRVLSPAIKEFQIKFPDRSNAQLVGREILLNLTKNPACTGIRLTAAIDESGQERIVYAAVDANNTAISAIADHALPCPPYCPKETGRLVSIPQTRDVASIGNFISEETAQRWMQNFKSKFPNVSASQSIDQSVLRIMLTNDNTQGVYFYNAMNQDGTVTIIPMACDQETSLLTSTTTGIDQFREAFPARAKAQLVGRNILSTLLKIEGVAAILVANAIDDQEQEKLVYIALDQNNLWISKSGDGTMPCPPYCPKTFKQETLIASIDVEKKP